MQHKIPGKALAAEAVHNPPFLQQLDSAGIRPMMIRMLYLARLIVVAILPVCAVAQDYSVVFEGRPLTRVDAEFGQASSHTLSADESFEYLVRIVERDGKFYWASRGMKELLRNEGIAYVTYHAADGSGYVRTLSPFMLDIRDQLPQAQRDGEVGYMEHVFVQLQTITYFGNRAVAP